MQAHCQNQKFQKGKYSRKFSSLRGQEPVPDRHLCSALHIVDRQIDRGSAGEWSVQAQDLKGDVVGPTPFAGEFDEGAGGCLWTLIGDRFQNLGILHLSP